MADGVDGRGDGTAELLPVARALSETVPLLVERVSIVRPGQIYRQALELLERPLLKHVLAMTGGNQLRAARLLGLNRTRCASAAASCGSRCRGSGGPPAAGRSSPFRSERLNI